MLRWIAISAGTLLAIGSKQRDPNPKDSSLIRN